MIGLEYVGRTSDSGAGGVHAIQDATLIIQGKEAYGIIDFSGAGKPTLVRCINLLERPSRGAVMIDDQGITKMKDRELRMMCKKISMISQHFDLMCSHTACQNVAFPLKGSGSSKAEMDQKICRLLKLMGLSDKADAYPSQFSGGQKQRMTITRALADDPKVLLCNEATSVSDLQTTKNVSKLLKRANKELGITIVLITREMIVIKKICDRMAIMESGYIMEGGSIIGIFPKPQAEVTCNFIASTSNAHRMQEMLDAGASAARLEKKQRMMKLNYDSINTSKALISEISGQFLVDTNIIFGNVEIAKSISFGDLIVIPSGEEAHTDQALACLEAHEVGMEVMKSCQDSRIDLYRISWISCRTSGQQS